MKSPREILLERHRQAEPRLDAIRRKALAALPASSNARALETSQRPESLIWLGLKKAWLELIWSSRQAWAGMAALWLVVAAANLEMKNSVPAVPVTRSAPVRELAQGLEEQRRLLSELLQTPKTPAPEPPRSNPRPRSERQLPLRSC